MPDRQELEQLRDRFQTAQQDLRDAERDINEATTELDKVEQELRAQGFDPSGDLPAQLKTKEDELDGILTGIESNLAAAQGRVPQPAGE